jgi:hypothetical protein
MGETGNSGNYKHSKHLALDPDPSRFDLISSIKSSVFAVVEMPLSYWRTETYLS